jgi:arylsulfatase A-like enzyme
MRPLIEGNSQSAGREYVITGWGDFASVRDREWNYVVNFEKPQESERLYHLRTDPFELDDVASQHGSVVRERRRRLEALVGQELPPQLPDRFQQGTIAPCRAYYGSRPTRAQEEAGFV